MDNLVSTDLDSDNSYTIDEMDMGSLTSLQQSNHDNNLDGSGKDNALTGPNPGYTDNDTQNTMDGTASINNVNDNTSVLDMDSDDSTIQLEYDFSDSDSSSDSDNSNHADSDTDHGQQQESVNYTLDNNNDVSDLEQNDTNDDNTQSMWNTAEVPTEEDSVEQGAVEASDIDDRLGSTLDEALEALVNEEQAATISTPLGDSMMISSSNSTIDSSSSSSLIGYNHPSSQHNSSSTIGYEGMDDFAMIDFSCWLYGAIFILICLRLPYVKRYFSRLGPQDVDSNATLPLHTSPNKELD